MRLKGVYTFCYSAVGLKRGHSTFVGPCDQTSIPFLVFRTCRDNYAHFVTFTERLGVVKWPSNVYKKKKNSDFFT